MSLAPILQNPYKMWNGPGAMTNNLPPLPLKRSNRIGFHYFPDTLHFRESDLHTWLPRLQSLGAGWLVLQSQVSHAIPEAFITALCTAGIEPIIHFPLSLHEKTDPSELSPLLTAYARWGVRTVIFFDRPNPRASWPAAAWTHGDLVETFLDRFIPLAELAQSCGLTPVFPPLTPGGDYWDLAFLRLSLESLQRRQRKALLSALALSAYAWAGSRPLNWGVGGPERWPQAHAYASAKTPDQRGFRIFDWYLAVHQAVTDKAAPIFLLQAGLSAAPTDGESAAAHHTRVHLALARLAARETPTEPGDSQSPLEPLPEEVAACCFWLLSADAASPLDAYAWFPQNRPALPAAAVLQAWQSRRQPAPAPAPRSQPQRKDLPEGEAPPPMQHPIRHYLLLPTYEWGVADWQLNALQPLIKKFRPTVGFSLAEAALAARVTVLSDPQSIPEEALDRLRQTGSRVDRIAPDGTSIATFLTER